MGRLRITWGGLEANRMGEGQLPGPYAVGIMSVVCSLVLPNLKYIELQQTAFRDGERDYYGGRFRVEVDAKCEAECWPDHLKIKMMGQGDDEEMSGEQSDMIRATKLMIEACGVLQELELQDWNTRGRAQWWREVLEKDGLSINFTPN
ncbi:hypothetical protein B7463_g11130, partial [Scytalidium lignicola]